MEFLSTLILAVLITSLTTPVLKRLALRYNLVDIPNERKVHSQPIPRVGGVAMALGAFVPLIFWGHDNNFMLAYLSGAAVLIVFGLVDDLRDISPKWKLLGQSIAAAVVISRGDVQIITLGSLVPEEIIIPAWILITVTMVVIVGVTNAINLSDGLDGLAGGISLLSIATIGFLAWQEGDMAIGLIAVALCGAIFGFLRFNTFPASIFMGDTGSQLLGFTAITLALSLTQGDTPLSPALPLLVLGFPILDTLTVMTSRIAHGRSPFSADKGHFHHSPMARGLHQTESVVVIYVIQVTLILLAYYFRFYSDLLLLGGYLVFSALVVTLFSVSKHREWDPKHSKPLIMFLDFRWLLRSWLPSVKYLFQGLRLFYPAVLVLIFSVSGRTQGDVALLALMFLLLLVVFNYFLSHRFEFLLQSLIYLTVPYGVYLSERWIAGQAPIVARGYDVLFVLLVLLSFLVSKMTQRQSGFKSTPLDFLIFFLAAVPLLPITDATDFRIGLVAAKIIILYYGCEILMPELRGKYSVLTGGIAAAMVIVAVRWFI